MGGFVIARDSLDELVPVENAAMPERTVIQWDKDDLDALGLLKVDVLGLGMLSAMRRAFDLVNEFGGPNTAAGKLDLASVPKEDPAVYDMICRADTIGVFQIESRAQMSMLPRLRPRNYYDLVIEVAIVRPGPIQGEMVHPYLRRRSGAEPVTYPSEAVATVLERTLGVPIFQEQVMKIAMVAAGFSAGQADELRRAMAAWKRKGGLEPFQQRLIDGMRERGYPESFAQQIFKQILGFGDYGFPEAHAASFALLVYISSWLKHHEPAAFCAALINSQPMGFYEPAQLVRDARAHAVEVRPVAVAASDYDCTIERAEDGRPALRLGLRLVKHLSKKGAKTLGGGACPRCVRAHRRACGAGGARSRRSRGPGRRRRAGGPCRASASCRLAGERRGARVAAIAGGHRARRGCAAAAGAQRRPGHRCRLRQRRAVAAPPSLGAAAHGPGGARRHSKPSAMGPTQRPIGNGGGVGHHASAAGQRERDVRHPGRRNGLCEFDPVGARCGGAASSIAGIAAAFGAGYAAAGRAACCT